ncbi:hypothetical protein HG536_0D02210 [Torulaspora globosa]|uniref:BSD domain-containing protein n=1 Tax=Torulaspora globosa TaxID=48254 RepID=A0A7G3ZGR3_9SACH|nr:uncharacterized protein HG536_0D02210 [Torulaspora globosa]QLL32699.1 hypothetical protein HG536_0D02210 [Torulaspora globosa]
MEFFYDEQAVANAEPSKERDEKTEQVFNKFEDEVSKQYERTASALKKIIKEDEDGVKLNLVLNPEVSETAQRYLRQLDDNLQGVEKAALNYWSKVSDASFWPSVAGKLGNSLDKLVKLDETQRGEKSGQTASGAAGGNRTEAELKALSTNKALYLDREPASGKDFDADAKTEEIARILETDKDMANLMNEIVPESISYNEFWRIFFRERQKILDREGKRREILMEKRAQEEEIGWDDEDAEINEEEAVIVRKEDTSLEKDSEKAGARNEESRDDEDDDDWD